VGNYPGVTVERKVGEVKHQGRTWLLVDLPGTYSLAPRSPDEMVTVDVLLGRQTDVAPPAVNVCVVSANNLQRNLYLVSQVLELGRPVVIALTMNDLAEADGQKIDAAGLSARIGVPVVPVHARRGTGLDELKSAVEKAGTEQISPAVPSLFPEAFRKEVDELEAKLRSVLVDFTAPRYLVERLLLDVGPYMRTQFALEEPAANELQEALSHARQRLADAGCRVPEVETTSRFGWVSKATEGLLESRHSSATTTADKLDAVLTHKVWGSLILAVVLLVMFSAVFSWATIPMDWIDAGIGAVSQAVEGQLSEGALRSLIVDGVIGGVGAVVIFLPQIFILFLLMTALEECGYMARAAYLMDKVMLRFGLSGRSFIPLLSSFACAIPGVMAARVIENRSDRLTTILIAPLMSCSARLPVYTMMIAAFIPNRSLLGGALHLQGLTLFAMYSVGVVVAAIVAWLLKRTLLKSSTPVFVMEMPEYQWPSLRVILSRATERGLDFVKNAGTVIFAVSILMWGALYYPRASSDEFAAVEAEKQVLETSLAEADKAGDAAKVEELTSSIATAENKLAGIQQRQSFLGRAGRLIEPVVRPLGWDWRIGSAVIASFPAREVVVATMGVIFDVGADVEEEEGQESLRSAMKNATWPETGKPLFNVPVALSIMVFFALCAQCISTLAVIGRETQGWQWPLFSFVYMTGLAYVAAFAVYRIGILFAAA
jgi:ferrous iron transport protein B